MYVNLDPRPLLIGCGGKIRCEIGEKRKTPPKTKVCIYIYFFNFGDLGFVCCFVEWVGIPCWIRQHRRQVEPSPHTWAPLMNFGCPLRSHLRYFLISLICFFFFGSLPQLKLPTTHFFSFFYSTFFFALINTTWYKIG